MPADVHASIKFQKRAVRSTIKQLFQGGSFFEWGPFFDRGGVLGVGLLLIEWVFLGDGAY